MSSEVADFVTLLEKPRASTETYSKLAIRGTIGGAFSKVRDVRAFEIHLETVEIHGVQFVGGSFSRLVIEHCQFHRVYFYGTDLSYARVSGTYFDRCSFKGANLNNATFTDVTFHGMLEDQVASCRSLKFHICRFDDSLKMAKFRFPGASFRDCSFSGRPPISWMPS